MHAFFTMEIFCFFQWNECTGARNVIRSVTVCSLRNLLFCWVLTVFITQWKMGSNNPFTLKIAKEGAPGWHSELSVWILVLVPVVISGSWNGVLCQASHSAGNLLEILSLSLCPPPLMHMYTHILSLSKINLQKTLTIGSKTRNEIWWEREKEVKTVIEHLFHDRCCTGALLNYLMWCLQLYISYLCMYVLFVCNLPLWLLFIKTKMRTQDFKPSKFN